MIQSSFHTVHVVSTHPVAFINCNIDKESLFSYQKRSIASLANSAQDKHESNVDCIMKTDDQLYVGDS
jgi:hypothetical protein